MRSLYLVSADCVQFLEHSFEICRFLPIAPHVNVTKPHVHHHANAEKIKAQELGSLLDSRQGDGLLTVIFSSDLVPSLNLYKRCMFKWQSTRNRIRALEVA